MKLGKYTILTLLTLSVIILSISTYRLYNIDQEIKDDYRFEGCLIGIYNLTGMEEFQFCAATIIKLNKQLKEKSHD